MPTPMVFAQEKSLPAPAKWKPGVLQRGEDGKLFLGPAPEPGTLVVCAKATWADGCQFRKIGRAAGLARDGDVIVIAPGRYAEAAVIRSDRVTIRAQPGAHMVGVAAEGKAALVIKGDDVTVEGLECSQIRVRDRNGACIRLEGRGLTLKNVYFHDSQEGVLGGGGRIVIEDSRFERLGAGGRAHGLYVWGEEVVVRRTKVLSSKDQGHGIKSRAARTVIEQAVVASLDGDDSRLIDVSNGGEVIIRDSVLQIGPRSVNHEMIGVGYEGLKFSENSVLIEKNTIILDHQKAKFYGGPVPATIRDNLFIGGQTVADNAWESDRETARLPPYPALDSMP